MSEKVKLALSIALLIALAAVMSAADKPPPKTIMTDRGTVMPNPAYQSWVAKQESKK